MIDKLSFLRQDVLWPALAVGAVVFLLFVWKEYTQTGIKRLFLKTLVALLAVISLLGIFLQPLITERQGKGVGVLLTTLYKSEQLDSLKKLHKGIFQITYKENQILGASLDSLQRLYMLGEGVKAYDFWQFKQLETIFLPGDKPKGIVRINYKDQLTIGDSLKVQGLYTAPELGAKLTLEGPSGIVLDSMIVGVKDDLMFNLVTKPKVAGRFVYRLVLKDSLDGIRSSDPLPVVITERERLSILIINTFPTFETKYLKNFLAESGHQVLVRSQLTKDKFKFESFNRDKKTIYGFTAQNLEDFELVITDVGSYRSLSGASQQALKNQIEKRGLGIFIQPEKLLIEQGDHFGFRLKRKNSTVIQLKDFPKTTLVTYPFTFRSEALLQKLITSQEGALTAYYQQGSGRIGTAIVQDTYQLVLDGKEELYQYLWSTTLAGVAQKSILPAAWNIEKKIAQVDEPLSFNLRTSIFKPAVMVATNDRIPLQQNSYLTDQWDGILYPKKRGWHSLYLAQDSTARAHYYVADSQVWKHKMAYDKREANQKEFAGHPVERDERITQQPINRFWFLLAFVIAMGFLWFEPRFSSD